MDIQDLIEGRCRGRYERLNSVKVARTTRWFWMKRYNGRVVKVVKLSSRSRKLNWKPFSITMMLSRKIGKIYAEFLRRMKMDEVCPGIVFSCQWGLPVLSHSSVTSRNNPICF